MSARAGLAIALLGAACGGDPGPPPYGFGAAPEQRFRLETRGLTVVDGESAQVERVAEVVLRAAALDGSGVELELYLDRYQERVARSTGDGEEVEISPRGVRVRRGSEQLRLDAGDPTPSAASVAELLERAAGGVAMDSRGRAGPPWRSHDPLLAQIAPLEWLLLGLPPLDPGAAWRGTRRVPQLGRYRLGIELPLVFERLETGAPGGAASILMSGLASREDLHVAEDLRGAFELELHGRSELDPYGRLVVSALELEFRFTSPGGPSIHSTQDVRIDCLDCSAAFNPPGRAPDLPRQ